MRKLDIIRCQNLKIWRVGYALFLLYRLIYVNGRVVFLF